MNTRVTQNGRQRYGRYLAVESMLVLMVSTLVAERTPPVLEMIQESSAHHNARTQWWWEARFGIFVHSGLFSVS